MKGLTPDMESDAELILELYSNGNASAIYR